MYQVQYTPTNTILSTQHTHTHTDTHGRADICDVLTPVTGWHLGLAYTCDGLTPVTNCFIIHAHILPSHRVHQDPATLWSWGNNNNNDNTTASVLCSTHPLHPSLVRIPSQHSKQFNMDILHIRRQTHKLTLMYTITNNHIDIDPRTYLHNTSNERTCNTHNLKYQTYHTNTDAYKHSYFPRTIWDWNRLPQHIFNSKIIDSLTKQIHTHLSPQHPYTNNYTWFTSLPAHSVLTSPQQPTPYICVICIRTGALRIISQNQN